MGRCTLNRSAHIASRCSQGATSAFAARLRRCRLRSTVDRGGGRPVRARALNALRCAKCTQYAKYAKLRNRRLAALILGARSPRTRPRARARYLFLFTRRQILPEGNHRTKIRKLVAHVCPMDTSGWGCFAKFFDFFSKNPHKIPGLGEDWRRTVAATVAAMVAAAVAAAGQGFCGDF